jgi:phage gpG-like protein
MNIRKKLRKQVLDALQRAEIGEILVIQAQTRLETKGRDVGGYAPLWADSAKILIRTKKGRKRSRKKGGGRVGEVYEMQSHYRKGGKPLMDTMQLFSSMSSRTERMYNGLRIFLRLPLYGIYQHYGFTTKGPNFIPFTRGAVRRQKSALKRGEYVYAKNGVTVPARPILAMPSERRKEIVRGIAWALGAR